jgi:biopolymer transport protein ExbD
MGMRKHKNDGPGGVNLGLIITPMLDMSFQILSFFIMTYNPSALEGHIPGSLAPPLEMSKNAPENKKDDIVPLSVDPADILAEVQDAITVIVKTGGADPGKPGKIAIQRKTSPAPEQVEDASVKTWKETRMALASTLKQLNQEPGVEKANIKIAADADLQQQYVMEVYDICKQSGFPKIHFIPPPMTRNTDK